MKMAVYYGPDKILYEDGQKPKAGKKEIVIRLSSVGLCGTDIHKIVNKTVPEGTVLGHEVSGIIEEVGEGIKDFSVGDRVYSGHHVPCFTCDYCTHGHHSLCRQFKETNFDPGGFAEFIRLSEIHVRHNLRKIPQGVSYDQAAMAEPIATVVHGMKRISVLPGDTAVVMGAGPIGCIWVQALRCMGADQIIVSDAVDYRLQKARELGASSVVNIRQTPLKKAIGDLTDGRGPNIVVIAAGISPLLKEAIDIVAPGGQIMVFAQLGTEQPIDASCFFNKEVAIIGAYSSIPTEFGSAMSLISQGFIRPDAMITHHFPLSKLADAVKLATDPSAQALKIMLHPE